MLYQWQSIHHANERNAFFGLSPHAGAVAWSRPTAGWLKANVDAAMFHHRGNIGVGCIVRDYYELLGPV